jgi:hypothetical protein
MDSGGGLIFTLSAVVADYWQLGVVVVQHA